MDWPWTPEELLGRVTVDSQCTSSAFEEKNASGSSVGKENMLIINTKLQPGWPDR